MTAKELMIVLFIVILLLAIIIFGVTFKKTVVPNEEKVEENIEEIKKEYREEEFVDLQEDGSKLNTSEELKKTKTLDGLEISNITLIENNNVSKIVANVKNTTDEPLGDFGVVIIVSDKSGTELARIKAYINLVEPGKSTVLNTSATVDFANAYDFKIEKY